MLTKFSPFFVEWSNLIRFGGLAPCRAGPEWLSTHRLAPIPLIVSEFSPNDLFWQQNSIPKGRMTNSGWLLARIDLSICGAGYLFWVTSRGFLNGVSNRNPCVNKSLSILPMFSGQYGWRKCLWLWLWAKANRKKILKRTKKKHNTDNLDDDNTGDDGDKVNNRFTILARSLKLLFILCVCVSVVCVNNNLNYYDNEEWCVHCTTLSRQRLCVQRVYLGESVTSDSIPIRE